MEQPSQLFARPLLTPTGNGLNVLKVMPESAIKFGSYEAAKRALAKLEGHGDPQNINPYSKFVAGGAGGLVSQYGEPSSSAWHCSQSIADFSFIRSTL